MKETVLILFTIVLIACNSKPNKNTPTVTYPDIQIVSAMKQVMWEGKLGSSIDLDTLTNRKGLYGLGPVSYLQGELLINNGQSFVARVSSDTSMIVEKTWNTSAPFFVYGNVADWTEIALPASIKTIAQLENFIDTQTKDFKRPFVFKLRGQASHASIHIQNLPEGTQVSSPTEAHQGQMDYTLENKEVIIIGFFSTEHQGVFTHHDTFLHMHLITSDERKMGHLDAITMGNMRLYLPKE